MYRDNDPFGGVAICQALRPINIGSVNLNAPINDVKPIEYTNDELSIIREIQRKYFDATYWRFYKIGSEFIDGNTYTIWFPTRDILNKRDS